MNTDEVKPWKSAEAYWNGDFYLVETFSGYRLGRRDPTGAQHTLPPNADAQELGTALLDALAHSRFLSLEEARVVGDYKKGQEEYVAWTEALMARHDYKTKRALFENMARCGISLLVGDSQMVIRPQHHDQLEGWGRTKDDGIEDVIVPLERSSEEVGKALLLAFSRCT